MTNYSDTIAALVGVSCFLLLFYGPWQSAMTDFARQIIFEQRDALFDMARSGKLDFESREYRILRGSLNKLIRFSHELTWLRLLIFLIKFKNEGSIHEPSDATASASKISNEATRKEVSEKINKAQTALVIMIGAKSIILFAPVCLAILFLWCSGSLGAIRRFLSPIKYLGEHAQIEAERA